MDFCKPCISSGGGYELPALENPASAAEILSGFQAVDGGGNVVTGEYVAPDVPDVPETVTVTIQNSVADSVHVFHAGGILNVTANTTTTIECYTGAIVAIETPTASPSAGIDNGTRLVGNDSYGNEEILVFRVESGSKIWIG